MQIQLVDLLGIPTILLFYIIILLLRKRDVENATNALDTKTQEVWTSVYPSITIETKIIQAKVSEATEVFQKYAEVTKSSFQDEITKTVIIKSYLPIFLIGFLISVVLSIYFPVENVLRILWVESTLAVILVQFLIDLYASYPIHFDTDKLRKLLCGVADVQLQIMFIICLILSQTVLLLTLSYFLSQLDSNSMIVLSAIAGGVAVFVPQVLKEIGINHWKIRSQNITFMAQNIKGAAECTMGLYLLEDAHQKASGTISEFASKFVDASDNELSSGLSSSFKPVQMMIDRAQKMLTEGSQSSSEHSGFVIQFRQYYQMTPQELILMCYDKYTDVLEQTNEGMQFCLSFAFSNKEYLDGIVKKKRSFLKDEDMMVTAIMHIVQQHHIETESILENEVLARIGVSEVKRHLLDGQVKMADVVSQIELHSGNVQKITSFLSFAQSLHEQELGAKQFKQPMVYDEIASILYSKPQGIDDDVLETSYNSSESRELDFRIICASRPDELQTHNERIRWIERFNQDPKLKSRYKKDQLHIPIRMWLEHQKRECGTEKEIAHLIAAILSNKNSIDLKILLSASSKILDVMDSLISRMLTRTSRKEMGEELEVKGMMKHLESDEPAIVAIALLTLYGTNHFDAIFPLALCEAIDAIRKSGIFTWSELLIDSLYKPLDRPNKVMVVRTFLQQMIPYFSGEKFDDVQVAYETLFSAIAETIVAAIGPFHKKFRVLSSRFLSALEILEYITEQDWIFTVWGIPSSIVSLLSNVFGIEEKPETLALSLAVASYTECEVLLSRYIRNMIDDRRYPNSDILRVLKFWRSCGVSCHLYAKTIIEILNYAVAVPDVENKGTHEGLVTLQNEINHAFVSVLHQITPKEAKAIIDRKPSILYKTIMRDRRIDINEILRIAQDIIDIILWCSIYPLDYRMVLPNQIDVTELIESVFTLTKCKNESEVTKERHRILWSSFKDILRGEPSDSYITFLIAVIVNDKHLHLKDKLLDRYCREIILKNEESLDYAVLFKFIYQDGQNPLALTYTDLEVAMKVRKSLQETDESDDNWSLSRDQVKNQLLSETHWAARLHFLDPVERKIREAHSRIEDLKIELKEEEELTRDARILANRLLNIDIADTRIIEYISRRSYNYFLLTWVTPRSESTKEGVDKDADTLGKRIDEWLEEREAFYGYTIKLTRATRIGKIPLGMTFNEFKRSIGNGLMVLREQLEKKPNVFLVCWSPSTYSAHALSGKDTIDMNPIESLRATFRKLDIDDIDEIDKFIERQFFGPRSMEDAIAALNENYSQVIDFWEQDPIDFMEKFAILTDEILDFIKKNRARMTQLYNDMKGKMGLHEFAGIDARFVAERNIMKSFKRCSPQKKKDAIEAAYQILYTLKLIFLLDISPQREEESPNSGN